MVKRFLYLLLLSFLIGGYGFTQEDTSFNKTGKVASQLTFPMGVMLDYDQKNIYLHGILTLYFSEKVAFYSDSYFFIDHQGDNPRPYAFQDNHSIFSGLSFHFLENSRFDPFVSIQPGASFNRLSTEKYQETDIKVNPVVGVGGGINYFVSNFFNFFLSAKYVYGQHLSAHFSPYSLNSLRVSGGLGINFRVFGSDNQ